jgi:inhibitor of KinA sporulation pathway (predicted exonuclease)
MEAPSLEEALDHMISWLSGYEVTFYSWSRTDYVQITREIQAKGMDEEKLAVLLDKEHWVDYQQTAGKRFGKPWRMSLEDALMFAEVEPEGKQHDGLVDARNTARLIAKMEKNPESRFLQDRLEKEKNEEQLGTSLGSLLGNIRI